jgi:glyoxylase-like metal-dependent hydrolase (beta-lactamase superfamily II)
VGTQADAPDITPRDFVVPGITFDGDTTLEIDGLMIIARELGAGEAPATTAYYLPSTQELFPGDAILNRLHGPLREAHTGPWLGILDRIEKMYPNVTIVHPGHGASGPKEPMFDYERLYLRTCRAVAAEEIARGGFTDAAKAATVRRINARFPYANPTGIKDIVSDSVEGLFRECSQPSSTPLP